MGKLKMKKILILLTLLNSFVANACWYEYKTRKDYISGINNFEYHTIIKDAETANTSYIVKNNMKVDFPISVSVKIFTDTFDNISISETNKVSISTDIQCKLQYRILPNGGWITVNEQIHKVDSIDSDLQPSFYLGRNNIMPLNCKAGDVIMIRLYVTNGVYQTGDLNSMCDKLLKSGNSTENSNLKTLNDEYTYKISDTNINEFDLGGGWFPHSVVTVIYSGNIRPIR